jgi:hypothetical protein
MPLNAYVHNPLMISKLKSCTQFDAQADPTNPGWLQLRSRVLNNQQLYKMLQAIWPVIVGAEPQKFAMIHCRSGQHAGVWLHLLPNDEYEPGCHEVESF